MQWIPDVCLYCEKAIEAGQAYCSAACQTADSSNTNVNSPPHSPHTANQQWRCPPLLASTQSHPHASTALSPPQSATSPKAISYEGLAPQQPAPLGYSYGSAYPAYGQSAGVAYPGAPSTVPDPSSQWMMNAGKYRDQYPNSLSETAIEFAHSYQMTHSATENSQYQPHDAQLYQQYPAYGSVSHNPQDLSRMTGAGA